MIKSKDKWMGSFFEKACTCDKMVKEMHISYEAFSGGVTCVPQVWVSKAAGFTAAWLAQMESTGLLSGRARVQTPAGPTLRVFK